MTVQRRLSYLRTLPRLGFKALLYNFSYRAGLKSGRYRRILPETDWALEPVAAFVGSPWCRPVAEEMLKLLGDERDLIERANAVVQGRFVGFSWRVLDLDGDWQRNPDTAYEPPKIHWSKIPSLPGAQAGDIKWTWEASRFEWVYTLGRAWVLNQNPEYPSAFWGLLESWRRDNPPQQGVNWMSGQESALKIFALLWAANLWMDKATVEQSNALVETVEKLAETVEAVIGYALSQRNNHGLGEAVALYLVGCTLQGHPRSEKWKATGYKIVLEQIQDQFAADGSYIQHSNNYARVALRYVSIFITTLSWSGRDLEPSVRNLLLEAVKLLWAQQDHKTGLLPNYGANDGANPMALNSCGYGDFRPILYCVFWQLTGKMLYQSGPWSEELLWIRRITDSLESFELKAPEAYAAHSGGYYVFRGLRSHAMLRCTSLRSRPSHADMLHLDLWADGKNLLSDGGTFQYVDATGWGAFLSSTAAHNTIEINKTSQMTRGGQFLWLDWTRASVLNFMQPGKVGLTKWHGQYLAGEHYGYYSRWLRKGVIHRRQLFHISDQWLIVDDIIAKRINHYCAQLNWHLDGVTDWKCVHSTESGICAHSRSNEASMDIVVWGSSGGCLWGSGETSYPATLRSRYYGLGYPSTLLSVEATGSRTMRWVTTVGQVPDFNAQAEHVLWQGLAIPLAGNGRILEYG